jgi:hypothetical protein
MSLSKTQLGRKPNSIKQIKKKNPQQLPSVYEHKNKNFCVSLKYLVKINKLDRFNLMETRKIVPKTNFSDKYLDTANENQIILISLLRDKSLQIFREQTKEFECQEQRALQLLDSGQYERKKHDFTYELVNLLRKKTLLFLKNHVKSMLEILNELPGLQKLNKHDQHLILNNQFIFIFGIRTIKLFLADDFFLLLDENVQMDRNVFAAIMGENVRDSVFEFFFNLKAFKLTDEETALLLPYFLSSSCKFDIRFLCMHPRN